MLNSKQLFLIFFTALATLFQLFFAACVTIWQDVILIPSSWLCPPVSKEYWFWYVDEYVSSVAYESQLIRIASILQILCGIVFFIGIYLLLKHTHATAPSVWRFAVIATIADAVLCIISLLYYRTYGQPYYLYMYMTIPELLALLVLALTILLHCTHKASESL